LEQYVPAYIHQVTKPVKFNVWFLHWSENQQQKDYVEQTNQAPEMLVFNFPRYKNILEATELQKGAIS